MSDTQEQTSSAPESSPEERLAAFFGGNKTGSKPEAPAEPQADQPAAEAEQPPQTTDDGLLTADDLTDDEPQAPAVPDADGLEIVYNGEALRVPKDEAKNLAQLGYHLKQAQERVTGELTQAQQRAKAILEVAQNIEKTAPQVNQLQARMEALQMLAASKGLNPQTIYQVAQVDPAKSAEMRAEFDLLNQQYLETQNMLNQVHEKVKADRDTVSQEAKAAERDLLPKLLPQAKDPAKFESIKQTLTSYLQKARPQTIEAIDTNAEVFAAFAKAAEYDRLQAGKREKLQSAGKAPQVVKPGSATTAGQQNQDRVKALRQQLKKSGSVDDAARLLRARMR